MPTRFRPAFNVANQLLAYAAELHQLEPWDLVKRGKLRQRFLPRFAVIWTLRQMCPPGHRNNNPYSYPRLAKLLGYEDHTSIMYAEKEAAKQREIDPGFKELTDRLLAYAQSVEPRVQQITEAA